MTVTRKEVIDAANILFERNCNSLVKNAYKVAYGSSLPGLIDTVILACIADDVQSTI